MGILSSPNTNDTTSPQHTPARLLPPTTRQQIVRDVLAGKSISQLAQQHHVMPTTTIRLTSYWKMLDIIHRYDCFSRKRT